MVNWKYLAVAAFFAVSLTAMGVGMYYAGYYAEPEPAEIPGPKPRVDITELLQDEITASNIDNYLKHLASVPHLAGTEQDLEQAEWVRSKFEEFGLDEATVVPYEVLLSYPKWDTPNKVYLLNSATGGVVFETSGTQTPIYAEEEFSSQVAPNFNAYSAPGTVQGDLVYVHYGREEDYAQLTKEGIDVAGKIILARYGAVFRANIVATAEQKGAIGVILFSDPQDFAQSGRDFVYADSWWMPGMAVQSGTAYVDNGDPLTPFYPSIESAYRIDQSKAKLPKIPVQPIGYDEAEVFLRAMKRNEAPESWQGALNTTYCFGPGMENGTLTVKLEVHTSNKMRTTYNTIGILYGDEEPDRYVLVGNHRDAWSLGSIDPSSGTASMLEMARAFGAIKEREKWRPRRSIVFCSWGAEEYGLIGSYEWVEQHSKVLSQRAIAYLNVDIAVEGNYSLWATAAPILRTLLVESSKKIANPNPAQVQQGKKTIFDTWAASFPDGENTNEPKVGTLGSGSDYTAFMHVFGIPALDMRYTYQEDIGSYPLYHTLYETHHLSGAMMDKGFVHHRAVTQLWAEIARNLTESNILPFDVQWYASYLRSELSKLKIRYTTQLNTAGITFDYFEAAVSRFSNLTKDYVDNVVSKADGNNLLALRRINDRLIQLERHFVDPRGLPNRPEFNHVVFAPSASDGYASSSFSGLTDLLEAVKDHAPGEDSKTWSQIQQHLSVIAFYTQAAAQSLVDGL